MRFFCSFLIATMVAVSASAQTRQSAVLPEEFTLEITNKYPKRFEIVDSKTWKAIVVSEGSTNAAPATVTFSAEGVSTQANKPYFLRLIDVNTLVTGITLVYSSSL